MVGRPKPQVGGFLPAEVEMETERAVAAHPGVVLPSTPLTLILKPNNGEVSYKHRMV